MCCPLQLPEGTTYDLDPLSPEASDYLWNGDYAGHKNVALELTHNYGTEALEGPVCEKNAASPFAIPLLALLDFLERVHDDRESDAGSVAGV